MARVKRSVNGKKHSRAILKEARGYTGSRSRHFKAANEQVMHSLRYAYRDRRARKGEFRKLWIQRINAACRLNGISYSRFISGLRVAESPSPIAASHGPSSRSESKLAAARQALTKHCCVASSASPRSPRIL